MMQMAMSESPRLDLLLCLSSSLLYSFRVSSLLMNFCVDKESVVQSCSRCFHETWHWCLGGWAYGMPSHYLPSFCRVSFSFSFLHWLIAFAFSLLFLFPFLFHQTGGYSPIFLFSSSFLC